MTGEEEPIRLERLLAAPIDEVFDAMTNAARMAQWFSPVGRAEVEANAVVGGRLRVVMVDEEVRLEHEGEFLEVRPPTRLVFTWRSRFTGDRPTVVTVELSDENGKTGSSWSTTGCLPRSGLRTPAGGAGSLTGSQPRSGPRGMRVDRHVRRRPDRDRDRPPA